MKKLAIIAVTAAFSTPALAAPGDTATTQGQATAEVVAPISLAHGGGALDFGTFTTGTGGGTVVVDATGGTASGDVTLVATSTESQDTFDVSGDAGRAFSISTTAGTVANGAVTMAFTTSAPATGTLSTGAATGTASFDVGGTLSVNGGEAAGVYSGTYDVTVTYN